MKFWAQHCCQNVSVRFNFIPRAFTERKSYGNEIIFGLNLSCSLFLSRPGLKLGELQILEGLLGIKMLVLIVLMVVLIDKF